MKGELMLQLDRWLRELADDDNHISLTYVEIAALAKDDLGVTLDYGQACSTVKRGGFTCASTRAHRGPPPAPVGGLTFVEFRDANIKRLFNTEKFKRCIEWTSDQWLKAFIGEVGELCNIDKKVDRGDYDGREREALAEMEKEFADIQTYLDLWAWSKSVDLTRATVAKFNEVSDRVGSDVKL